MISETDNFAVGGHAGSAEDALRQLQTKQVDLVVLDIEMPGMNGIEVSGQPPSGIMKTYLFAMCHPKDKINLLNYLSVSFVF